jgi:hypothetical protein
VQISHPQFKIDTGYTEGTSSAIATPTEHTISYQIEKFLVEEEGTGLYKTQYCYPKHRYPADNGIRPPQGYCGYAITVSPTGVTSPASPSNLPTFGYYLSDTVAGYEAWYHDTNYPLSDPANKYNNRRSGYVVTLTNDAGIYTFDSSLNGSPGFFPIDGSPTQFIFGNSLIAADPDHNFSFTTEVHFFFEYLGGETFTFTGDDDVWVVSVTLSSSFSNESSLLSHKN